MNTEWVYIVVESSWGYSIPEEEPIVRFVTLDLENARTYLQNTILRDRYKDSPKKLLNEKTLFVHSTLYNIRKVALNTDIRSNDEYEEQTIDPTGTLYKDVGFIKK